MSKYYQINAISYQTAATAVSIAIEKGKELGVAVSVAIVDPSMGLVAFGKAEGATPHSIETSRRKANTAASTQRETGWMDNSLEVTLPMAANNLLTNIPGGFPIFFDGNFVGALGIAGGSVEQDAKVAKATIETIGADLK